MIRTDSDEVLAQLQEDGVVVLQGRIPNETLMPFVRSAEACFHAVEAGQRVAYRFTPFSFSVILPALLEFGIDSSNHLLDPVCASGMNRILDKALATPVTCNLQQSWVRKRFASCHAPRHYQPNAWHQDGGLGVSYRPEADAELPMTRLLTCWLPLQACGKDSPGLEFIRRRLDALLHYTDLDDFSLRERFPTAQFWAPELEPGDAVLFLPGTLHRTYVQPAMAYDRLSLEYRFFPAEPASCY